MANSYATLIWDWQPAYPLVTGYRENLARAMDKSQESGKGVINLQTHDASADHALRPSFLATSVKGVFRSAAEWLVERVAADLGAERFVTCGYGLAVPKSKHDQLSITQRSGLCPVCQVFGGTGCLSGREVAPAQRQVGRVRFTFNAANDATYGKTANSPRYQFAWEQVANRGKPLVIEQLRFAPDTVLEARVEDADDFALALLWLAGDLISSGFFRFGRFTSRGYGVVRLLPAAYQWATLAAWLSETAQPQPVTAGQSGCQVARAVLGRDPLTVVQEQVQAWQR